MSPPWMPFYVGDYIGGTMHLSTLEHGAYMLLIMHYWQKGSLPTEDRNLASIVKLPLDSWLEIKPIISEFFHDGWKHRKVDKELAAAQQALSKRKAAGVAGAYARYGKGMPVEEQPESQPHANLPSPKEGSSNPDNSEPSVRERIFKSLGSPDGFFEEGEFNDIATSYLSVDHAARLKTFWPWAVGLGKQPTEIKAMYVGKLKKEAGSTKLVEGRATKTEIAPSAELVATMSKRGWGSKVAAHGK